MEESCKSIKKSVSNLKVREVDINMDIKEQTGQIFDMIVAYNVIHDSQLLPKTLQSIRDALLPGGSLHLHLTYIHDKEETNTKEERQETSSSGQKSTPGPTFSHTNQEVCRKHLLPISREERG